MKEILIKDEYIKLGQLLKLAGVSNMGAESKALIQDGLVKVNGSVSVQRGKKVRKGDIVTVKGYDDISVK